MPYATVELSGHTMTFQTEDEYLQWELARSREYWVRGGGGYCTVFTRGETHPFATQKDYHQWQRDKAEENWNQMGECVKTGVVDDENASGLQSGATVWHLQFTDPGGSQEPVFHFSSRRN
jgi:hypothetical protein